MARCRICGKEFPTSYMDMVSVCPECGTVYANTSPTLEDAEILSAGHGQKPARESPDNKAKENDQSGVSANPRKESQQTEI